MDLWGLERKSEELLRFYTGELSRQPMLKAYVAIVDGNVKGKELIDVSGDGKSIIGLDDFNPNKIDFATDQNGVFAAVVNGRYYPIESNTYDKRLREYIKKYERCGKSALMRLWYASDILLDYHLMYPLQKVANSLLPIVLRTPEE